MGATMDVYLINKYVCDKGHVETGIGSPVTAGDLVLVTCGWLGVRTEVVAVRPGGGRPKEVYRLTRSAPLCTTPLVVGELLFLWGDGGIVTCADVRTGEVHWRERVPGSYYSSPVCVGRHILNVSRQGDVVGLVGVSRDLLSPSLSAPDYPLVARVVAHVQIARRRALPGRGCAARAAWPPRGRSVGGQGASASSAPRWSR